MWKCLSKRKAKANLKKAVVVVVWEVVDSVTVAEVAEAVDWVSGVLGVQVLVEMGWVAAAVMAAEAAATVVVAAGRVAVD